MGNLLNNKCVIRKKKEGIFFNKEIEYIKNLLEERNRVYSDFYISKNDNELNIEYTARYYPFALYEEHFKSKYNTISILSDEGGYKDSMLINENSETALYKFDKIILEGSCDIFLELERNLTKDLNGAIIIDRTGYLEANTFNEEIADFTNRPKIIILDDNYKKKLVNDSMEIWSIKMGNFRISDELMKAIKKIYHEESTSRIFEKLWSIKFVCEEKVFHEIFWNQDKESWINRRFFDLWDIVKF